MIAVGGLNRRFLKSLAVVRAHAGQAGWRYAEGGIPQAGIRHSPRIRSAHLALRNGIHALDALLFMMGGLPEHLVGACWERAAKHQGAFSALMRWSDGAQGVFLCNNNSDRDARSMCFMAPMKPCNVTATGLTVERKGHPTTVMPLPDARDGFAAEHEAFVQAIRLGLEPPTSLAAIAPSMFVAQLIEKRFQRTRRTAEGKAPRGAAAAYFPGQVHSGRPAG